MECDTLLSQSVPRPPEVVGYLTADWAWKLSPHESTIYTSAFVPGGEGKAWTTWEGGR